MGRGHARLSQPDPQGKRGGQATRLARDCPSLLPALPGRTPGWGRDRQKITHMEETERELERELERLICCKEAKCGPYLLHRLI